MTETAALSSGAMPAPGAVAEHSTIATRFGELTVDPEKVITFNQGLYGMEHHRRFLLTHVPDWPDVFKLLQSVDDPGLGLIVIPLGGGSEDSIESADLEAACATLGYDPSATAIIGIVTMRDAQDSQAFTVNLKAPVLIDSHRRLGRQHVFASEKYPLRHPLGAAGRGED